MSQRRNRKGQGMTEYIIIVALVAIASIGVVTIFGNQVRSLFNYAVIALRGGHAPHASGGDSTSQIDKTLKDF